MEEKKRKKEKRIGEEMADADVRRLLLGKMEEKKRKKEKRIGEEMADPDVRGLLLGKMEEKKRKKEKRIREEMADADVRRLLHGDMEKEEKGSGGCSDEEGEKHANEDWKKRGIDPDDGEKHAKDKKKKRSSDLHDGEKHAKDKKKKRSSDLHDGEKHAKDKKKKHGIDLHDGEKHAKDKKKKHSIDLDDGEKHAKDKKKKHSFDLDDGEKHSEMKKKKRIIDQHDGEMHAEEKKKKRSCELDDCEKHAKRKKMKRCIDPEDGEDEQQATSAREASVEMEERMGSSHAGMELLLQREVTQLPLLSSCNIKLPPAAWQMVQCGTSEKMKKGSGADKTMGLGAVSKRSMENSAEHRKTLFLERGQQQKLRGYGVAARGFAISGEAGLSAAHVPSSSVPASTGPPHSTKDACESILTAIQRSTVAAAASSSSSVGGDAANNGSSGCVEQDRSVNLDHILSKVPYKDMLRDLFGSNASTTEGYRAPCIPVVSRAYEESYMRQPIYSYERPCVMGSSCECNFIGASPSDGFTAVEFLLPSEASALGSGQQPVAAAAHQMCVLCHRRLVQSLFYDIIYAGSPYRGIIQRYGNICNHGNEYARCVLVGGESCAVFSCARAFCR